jgi:homoserine O-acetyltransferase/O-succinyltransferase
MASQLQLSQMMKGLTMVSRRSHNLLIGLALAFIGAAQIPAAAEEAAAVPAGSSQAAPNSIVWDLRENSSAKQAVAWHDNYKFRDGERISRLRIPYATLGTPHRTLPFPKLA